MRRGKATLTLLAIFALVVMTSSGAFATVVNPVFTFTDTKNFTNNDQEITDSFTYTHTLTNLNDPITLQYGAVLSLSHQKNSNNSGERWFARYNISGSDNIVIGQLSGSSNNSWTTDSWTLSNDIIDAINNGGIPWTFTVYLYDNTTGIDRININTSILSGSYTSTPPPNPVPLPGSVLLFGSGLLGLIGIRSRRKSKS